MKFRQTNAQMKLWFLFCNVLYSSQGEKVIEAYNRKWHFRRREQLNENQLY